MSVVMLKNHAKEPSTTTSLAHIVEEMVRWKRLQHAASGSDDVNTVAIQQHQQLKHATDNDDDDGNWTAMFERLKVFKKVKGHCEADEDADEPELGQWVMSLRRHYVAFASSTKGGFQTSSLTHDRVQKLLELGLDLTSSTTGALEGDDDAREDAAGASTSTTTIRRKKKQQDVAENNAETRRPPKKRKKSVPTSAHSTEAEERDAPSHATSSNKSNNADDHSGERDDVSPLVASRPIKGRGDSAWETLMNVAALVPPLPTAPKAAAVATTATLASPTIVSNPGSPQPKKATKSPPSSSNSKCGTLNTTPTSGGSYSSKYRAANNDVVPNQQRWEDMFSRLQVFKKNHGHCRVPNRFPDDPSLGSWVATQRRYYKNKNLPMPEDRVNRLTDLGFEWTTKDPRKVPWETRFEGLQAFKEKYGHCDVPHEWEECPQLGFWTANMRQQYRYKQLGKKSSLTDDRIKKLTALGFVWKMQGGRRKKSDPVARPNQNPGTPEGASPAQGSTKSDSTMEAELSGADGPLVLDPSSMAVPMTGRRLDSGYIPPPNLPKQHLSSCPPMRFYQNAAI